LNYPPSGRTSAEARSRWVCLGLGAFWPESALVAVIRPMGSLIKKRRKRMRKKKHKKLASKDSSPEASPQVDNAPPERSNRAAGTSTIDVSAGGCFGHVCCVFEQNPQRNAAVPLRERAADFARPLPVVGTVLVS
jgi:hypothetical protein